MKLTITVENDEGNQSIDRFYKLDVDNIQKNNWTEIIEDLYHSLEKSLS